MHCRLLIVLLAAACSAGCTTIYSEGQAEADAEMQLAVQNLQTQVNRLQTRVDDMESQRQDLYGRMDRIESDVASVQREQQERSAAVDRGLTALEQARQRDREEIVNKVTDLVKTTASTRTAEGYEHVVKAGETLSAIASAYKVKPAAIMKANNLQNADTLRVGQKLFIPE